MKKTLQDQYLLIKEGKGHKGVFLTEAKRQFPNIVRNAASFDEAAASLITKNIISENVIGLGAINSPFEPKKKQSFETAFESFLAEAKKKENEDEKVKAEEKKVSKPVEEDYSRNFDRKDDKNIDNLIFDQVMTGYYAEMKDPKNADKTMQELKDIVMKNLQKDPIYYTKDGQFGVKGLGYTTEAPGLGTPKEAKGKYKSSGYGDLKENKSFEKPYLGSYGNNPHQSSPLDIEDYLEQVEGMSKYEAIEYLGKQGLSSSQALKVISQMDTDVRDMFDDTDVKIYGANDLYEQKLRKVIREMVDAEIKEMRHLGSLNTSNTSGGSGKRFIPNEFPFPQNIRKRFGDHMVYDPGKGIFYISGILYNNLVKGYSNQIAIKKLIGDIPPMVKQILNKPDNYNPTTDLNTYLPDNLKKEFNLYHPLNAEVRKAKADKFNKAGDKQYWSEGDLLFPNLNIMEEGVFELSLRESIEKELMAINKEAEQEIIASKLEKVQALIDKKQTQISRLDEDEDLKDLTDVKKVKEISKDIKSLEKAKAKLEKMMGKGKGKKKEVIDEDETEEYIEDADQRQDDGQSTDSIVNTYTNMPGDEREDLEDYLDARKANY